jgi:hypothetical protein
MAASSPSSSKAMKILPHSKVGGKETNVLKSNIQVPVLPWCWYSDNVKPAKGIASPRDGERSLSVSDKVKPAKGIASPRDGERSLSVCDSVKLAKAIVGCALRDSE